MVTSETAMQAGAAAAADASARNADVAATPASLAAMHSMDVDSLFRDRVPEAAARQLATVLAWLTECELATLESLRAVKRTSKADLARHERICHTAVQQCVDLGVWPVGLRGAPCVRLQEAMAAVRATHARG
jgi:hypothetical protein